MADNTTLNSGAGGDVVATEDIASVKYQKVKLVDGTDDSTSVIKATSNALWTSEQTVPPGGDSTNDVQKVEQRVVYLNRTTSGTVKATPGLLGGFFVNATSSGVIKIRDGGSAGTVVIGGASGVTVAVGSFNFGGNMVTFATDIYFDLVSGTADITLFYR